MRTPGRCTNHESCWLANGGRDIWVPVGDDFVCPVCAEPLTAPSLHSISMRSLAGAAAGSLALVALAGGAGFGVVRAVTSLAHGPHSQLTAMHPAGPRDHAAPRLAVAPSGTIAVASINRPSAAPVPRATPSLGVPSTTPPAPVTPAPTTVASATPPAPTVKSVPPAVAQVPKAPANAAPAAVVAAPPAGVAVAPPPAAPMHLAARTPVGAPQAEPTNAKQQIAAATIPPHVSQPQRASPPTGKPVVTPAASYTKVPPSAPSATIVAANPDGRSGTESSTPVPPVRPVPVSGPQPSAPRHVVVAQAITYGQPPGPEGEGVDSTGRWRHRAPHVNRSGFLTGPGWSRSEDVTESQTTPPYQVSQGDTEESAPGAATSFSGDISVPSMQGDTEASANGAAPVATADGAQVPGIVPQTAPRFEGAAGAETAPLATPLTVTHLSVPWISGRMPADVPAARVDVAAADAIDDAPDAPLRLARLPAAPKAKLALPEYPPIAEDLQQPGRVDVGCTITVRGEPSDCAVTRHVGAVMFANSVMSWLRSGEVRYRPHLVHGRPVPEARRYDVKFVP